MGVTLRWHGSEAQKLVGAEVNQRLSKAGKHLRDAVKQNVSTPTWRAPSITELADLKLTRNGIRNYKRLSAKAKRQFNIDWKAANAGKSN